MARTNRKREALREALGPGASLYRPGEVTGWLVTVDKRGQERVARVQVDGEHDGSLVLSQVGGVVTPGDVLAKSSRGTAEAREQLRLGRGPAVGEEVARCS